MILRKISGTNVKGRTFSLPLEPATIIIGPNMIGKTGVLDSIKLAAAGHVPGLDKTNGGIFSLSSGQAMSVLIETSEGAQAERSFAQAANGSVKKDERITHGFPAIPLVMLDANDFFSRSEAGRMEMIFNLVNLGDTMMEKRVQEVTARLLGNGETIRALQLMPLLAGESFQKWLERAISAVGEMQRIEAGHQKKMTATQQSLAALHLQADQTAPLVVPSAGELHALLAKERVALEAAREVKAARQAALNAVGNYEQRKLTFKTRIEELTRKRGDIDERRAAVARQTAELAAVGLSFDKPLTFFLRQMVNAEAEEKKVAQLHSDLIEKKAAIEKEMEETLASNHCPVCFTNKPTWKRKAKEKYDQLLADVDAAMKLAEEAKEATAKAAANGRAEWKQAEARDEKQNLIQRDLRAAERALEYAQSAAEQLAEVEKEQAEFQKLSHGADTDKALRESYQADMEFDDIQERVQKLEDQQQAVANRAAEDKALADARAAADCAKANVVQLKAGMEILHEARAHYMQQGIGPLLEIANVFAEGILPSKLALMGGEIGRTNEKGRWIPSRSFSGSEQGITHAAISAALGSMAPLRIVIFDELSRFSPLNKARFMLNVLGAIPKLIDQFIGADVDDAVYLTVNRNEPPMPLHLIPLK